MKMDKEETPYLRFSKDVWDVTRKKILSLIPMKARISVAYAGWWTRRQFTKNFILIFGVSIQILTLILAARSGILDPNTDLVRPITDIFTLTKSWLKSLLPGHGSTSPTCESSERKCSTLE